MKDNKMTDKEMVKNCIIVLQTHIGTLSVFRSTMELCRISFIGRDVGFEDMNNSMIITRDALKIADASLHVVLNSVIKQLDENKK